MKWLLTITILIFSRSALSQGINSLLDKSTNPGAALMEFDNRIVDIEGNYYVLDDWVLGNITLNSGTYIPNQLINYDLEYDMLEVKLESRIKVIPIHKIDNFTLTKLENKKRTFEPCHIYKIDNDIPLVGLCEVLDSNYFGLIIQYISGIKKSTYLPEFDMGKKENEIIIHEKFYLTFGERACGIPGKKQVFYNLYSPFTVELMVFINEGKMNYRNDKDLRKILSYMNALTN